MVEHDWYCPCGWRGDGELDEIGYECPDCSQSLSGQTSEVVRELESMEQKYHRLLGLAVALADSWEDDAPIGEPTLTAINNLIAEVMDVPVKRV